MKLKGAEIMCESLLREGVEVMFGHPGGAILPFYDALWSYPQLRHILVRHEQAAAHAADGYARVTGKVGVCVATSGPGATNLVTGIMGAKADSIPMVAITGQVARADMGKEAFQECDICSIASACTKRTYLVMSAADLAPTIREAFHTALEGRPGPVLVDVPRDVQLELAEFDYPPIPARMPPPVTEEVLDKVRQAARLINQAQRPVIISGHGVLASGATAELKALAETTGIPVINTLLGLSGFPRNHPLSLGMLGMHGMYWSNIAVNEADLVIGLGMRFDDRVTGKAGTFAPHARIIHLDIEASQIGRNVPAEVPLVGDAKTILQALLPLVKHVSRPQWTGFLAELKRDHPSLAVPHSDKLLAQHVLTGLNDLLQEHPDTVVVTGVGQHQMWAAQFLFFNRSDTFVSSGGLGAMGFELPAAMGAQVGRPGAPVWTVAGDGGFQMTLQELATITQEKLPVKIAVFNNGHLGMVRQWQELFFQNHIQSVPISSPDYVTLAKAYGIPGLRVTNQEDVAAALRQAQEHDGPFLVEFVIDPSVNVYPMVPPGGTLADTIEDPLTRKTA
ncbi:MAG: biosynthetic-type acetolactate synthase large subunit [Dehalococcoidia bacterium]|nr:biosynthetic-type acetolactate synthase large subunit [Dehalococcoidia bacterium]MSQ16168.1 biosynthetic-type acetolactate synthase large subunit [Dehalococcoidia bacterium]